jgi:hypothetical protein
MIVPVNDPDGILFSGLLELCAISTILPAVKYQRNSGWLSKKMIAFQFGPAGPFLSSDRGMIETFVRSSLAHRGDVVNDEASPSEPIQVDAKIEASAVGPIGDGEYVPIAQDKASEP